MYFERGERKLIGIIVYKGKNTCTAAYLNLNTNSIIIRGNIDGEFDEFARFATDDEKKKFLNSLHCNGFKYNRHSKEIELRPRLYGNKFWYVDACGNVVKAIDNLGEFENGLRKIGNYYYSEINALKAQNKIIPIYQDSHNVVEI